MSSERETPGSPATRNGYFVIHASAVHKDGGVELNGMMEDLTTGEKQVFDSAGDVSRLMEAWAARDAAPKGKAAWQADVSGRAPTPADHPERT